MKKIIAAAILILLSSSSVAFSADETLAQKTIRVCHAFLDHPEKFIKPVHRPCGQKVTDLAGDPGCITYHDKLTKSERKFSIIQSPGTMPSMDLVEILPDGKIKYLEPVNASGDGYGARPRHSCKGIGFHEYEGELFSSTCNDLQYVRANDTAVLCEIKKRADGSLVIAHENLPEDKWLSLNYMPFAEKKAAYASTEKLVTGDMIPCPIERTVYVPQIKDNLHSANWSMYLEFPNKEKQNSAALFYFHFFRSNVEQLKLAFTCSNGVSACRANSFYAQKNAPYETDKDPLHIEFPVVFFDSKVSTKVPKHGDIAPSTIIFNDTVVAAHNESLMAAGFPGLDVWAYSSCAGEEYHDR